MANVDITRAWKDNEYRMNLSPSDRASLPSHPAGWYAEELEEIVAPATSGEGPIISIIIGITVIIAAVDTI